MIQNYWSENLARRNVGRQIIRWIDDLVKIADKDRMRKSRDRKELSGYEETQTVKRLSIGLKKREILSKVLRKSFYWVDRWKSDRLTCCLNVNWAVYSKTWSWNLNHNASWLLHGSNRQDPYELIKRYSTYLPKWRFVIAICSYSESATVHSPVNSLIALDVAQGKSQLALFYLVAYNFPK